MEQPKNLGGIRKLEEGDAMMEAKCSVCNWKGEQVFEVGDEGRDMACFHLEDLHKASGCEEILEYERDFRERR